MSKRLAAAVAAVALCLPVSVALAPSAEAAGTYYSSCAKLTKAYSHGVAKSAAAASRQVRAGYSRPSTTTRAKKVYWKNYKRLDRDRDGTACER